MKPYNTALESQVKVIIDEYVTGALDTEGKAMTATFIARVVNQRHVGVKASPGGVHNIMVKWDKLGFITLAHGGTRPLTFQSYTDAAREVGLSKLKEQYYASRERVAATEVEDDGSVSQETD